MKHLRPLLFLLLAACAGGPQGTIAQGPPPRAGMATSDSLRAERAEIPPGFGTLRQDEFTLSLRSGNALLIKVTPLDESVTRLAAPDTYNRLHAMRESKRVEAARQSAMPDPALYLVSFFSYQPDVPFTPEDLQLVYQGRTIRPAAILPITGNWGRQQLGQQESQIAVYAFNQSVDPEQPLTVRYGVVQNDAWTDIVRKLEVERAKVLSRK